MSDIIQGKKGQKEKSRRVWLRSNRGKGDTLPFGARASERATKKGAEGESLESQREADRQRPRLAGLLAPRVAGKKSPLFREKSLFSIWQFCLFLQRRRRRGGGGKALKLGKRARKLADYYLKDWQEGSSVYVGKWKKALSN